MVDRQELLDHLHSVLRPPVVQMAKHLVDIDEEALRGAKGELGTKTIKDTVNIALRRAAGTEQSSVERALDDLARADLECREDAWR